LSKKLIYLIALSQFAFASEISVFGAGDLESPNPYGLSKTEKVIVKNKQELNSAKKKINRFDSALDNLSQRLEGLESVADSDGQKLFEVKNKFTKYQEEFQSYKIKTESFKSETDNSLSDIKTGLDEARSDINNNKQNLKRLRDDFEKIVKLVNDINSNYVAKKEFNKLLDMLDKKSVKKTVQKSKPEPKSDDLGKTPKKELMAEARKLFKIDYFTKAIPILEYLIENKYRPAECNYLMGEIKYYRKKYSEALHFFKTSMMLYDKAKYLPKLLLHSAISFEKIGDKDNALNFYNTLIDVYPDTNEAKEASKKIN
jgi:TolA-binding protein